MDFGRELASSDPVCKIAKKTDLLMDYWTQREKEGGMDLGELSDKHVCIVKSESYKSCWSARITACWGWYWGLLGCAWKEMEEVHV